MTQNQTPECCDYCSGDFNDLSPVFVRGHADLAVHRPGDKDDCDCAYWHDWVEFGRWETGRGTQGAREWWDGSIWKPAPYTEEPIEHSD